MENILAFFKALIDWYISTDLPKDTVAYVLNVVTYVMDNFVPLMWEYYYTIFGGAV